METAYFLPKLKIQDYFRLILKRSAIAARQTLTNDDRARFKEQ
jgi:hypothetical protein